MSRHHPSILLLIALFPSACKSGADESNRVRPNNGAELPSQKTPSLENSGGPQLKESNGQEPNALASSADSQAKTAAEPRPAAPGSRLSDKQVASLTSFSDFASPEYVKTIVEAETNEQWFGFYMADRKVGYATITARRSSSGEPAGFVVGMKAVMRADGEEMRIAETIFHQDKPPYKIEAIHTSDLGSTGSIERRFIREGDKTRVKTVLDGKSTPDAWAPAMCGGLGTGLATVIPSLSRLKKSSAARVCSFDASGQKQELNELRVKSIAVRRIGGIDTKIAIVQERSSASEPWSETTVTDSGKILRVAIGSGMLLKQEDQAVAQSEVVGIDVLSSAVKLQTPLGDPSTIKELKLRADFGEGVVPPDSAPDQTAKRQADGSYHLTMRSVPGAKVKDSELALALAASAEVNADDPKIVELAKRLSASEKSVKGKVAVLNHWVYENLEKSFSTNLGTASQVLAHKTGDCTEHTLLLLALLRAIEIPARELSGLIYMGNGFDAFGWHAWTEVAIDGRWVQVDPTWDEVVGNATHLKLGDGDTVGAMSNMGSIKLERL